MKTVLPLGLYLHIPFCKAKCITVISIPCPMRRTVWMPIRMRCAPI